MTIPFDPVLASSGSLAVRWYGLLALAGLGLAIWLSLRELHQQRLGRRVALDGLAWALPASILGARVAHVLGDWDYYLTSPSELWQLNLSGLSLWGGLAVGGLIFAARLGRGGAARQRRTLDVVVPFALIGIALGRLGQFIDGQGQGVPTGLAWATQYSNPLASTPDFGVPRHPAQLYDGLIALVLFAILWALARTQTGRALPAGTRAAIGIVIYSAARLLLGAVRLDPAFAFGLQIEQLLAIGGIVVGAAFGIQPLVPRTLASARPATATAATSPPDASSPDARRATATASLPDAARPATCMAVASSPQAARLATAIAAAWPPGASSPDSAPTDVAPPATASDATSPRDAAPKEAPRPATASAAASRPDAAPTGAARPATGTAAASAVDAPPTETVRPDAAGAEARPTKDSVAA